HLRFPVVIYPLGKNAFPFTRQPALLAPCCVAGGSLSISAIGLLSSSEQQPNTRIIAINNKILVFILFCSFDLLFINFFCGYYFLVCFIGRWFYKIIYLVNILYQFSTRQSITILGIN